MIIFSRHNNNVLNKWWWEIDKTILFSTLALAFIGSIMVLSTSPFVAIRIGATPTYFISNHFLYLFFAICLMLFISTLKRNMLIKLAIMIALISISLMCVVVFFSTEVKGAKRWVYIFNFSLQPSEFMKVVFPIILAYLWDFTKDYSDKLVRYLILAIFFIIFITLLLLQPDVGMTFLVGIVFFSFLILTGLNINWIFAIILITIAGIVFAYFTFPHVNYRVNSFLLDNNSYQINKSIEAFSGGDLWGVGGALGIVKKSLPDAHTDFIFAVINEEFGFFLGVIMFILYLLIMYKAILHASKSKDIFVILSSVCLSITLLVQALIHVSSNLNLIPTKGMTLPFVSYGGSSLMASFILVGFLLALSKKDISNINIVQSK